jgi:xanthine dehydrogenase accessory factor
VKHWQETATILGEVIRSADAGEQAAVATVVAIERSAYRRPGAKFLVKQGGATSGSVSGGCLEADVREVALAALREGAPRLLHYDTGSDDRTAWGLGLGCNGSVDILVQLATSPAALDVARRVRELLGGEEAFAVATMLEGERAGRAIVFARGGPSGSTGDGALDRELASGASAALERRETSVHALGAMRAFFEVLVPPPHLLVFGAGDDAIPLVEYAAGAGFRVTVVDHRPAFLTDARFPAAWRLVQRRPEEGIAGLPMREGACAVLKAHSLGIDRDWLAALLPTPLAYLGLLGPRARSEEMLRQIGAAPDDRVFAPIGLDVGAEGPEQVALSIVAELLAARAGRPPRHLRQREGAIHVG